MLVLQRLICSTNLGRLSMDDHARIWTKNALIYSVFLRRVDVVGRSWTEGWRPEQESNLRPSP
jgi:hypothetical protein